MRLIFLGRAAALSVAMGLVAGLGLGLGACEKQAGVITVDRVEPAAGTSAGGDQVSIIGSGFQPGKTQADVLFGRRKAENVIIASPTRITVVTPPGDRGPIDVSVMFHDGKAFKIPAGFKFVPPADVSATRKAWDEQSAKKAE